MPLSLAPVVFCNCGRALHLQTPIGDAAHADDVLELFLEGRNVRVWHRGDVRLRSCFPSERPTHSEAKRKATAARGRRGGTNDE